MLGDFESIATASRHAAPFGEIGIYFLLAPKRIPLSQKFGSTTLQDSQDSEPPSILG